MSVAVGLIIGAAAWPTTLAAQQSASVAVHANVIEVPLAPGALDSLRRAVDPSVSSPTRARVMADAARRGVRVRVPPAAPSRPVRTPVLLIEYVAN